MFVIVNWGLIVRLTEEFVMFDVIFSGGLLDVWMENVMSLLSIDLSENVIVELNMAV